MHKYIIVAGSLLIAYYLWSCVLLLYLSCLLAFLLYPLHSKLVKYTKSNVLAAACCVLLCLCLIISFLVSLVPRLYQQIYTGLMLIKQLPLSALLHKYLGVQYGQLVHASLLHSLQGMTSFLLHTIPSQSVTLLLIGTRTYIVLIMTFYILKDHQILKQKCQQISPIAIDTIYDIARSLTNLLKGQISIIIAMIVLYASMFYMYGLSQPIMLSLICACSCIVPYVGAVFSLIVLILSVLNHGPTIIDILATMSMFAFGNLVESGLLGPYFIGQRLAIHPLLLLVYVLSFNALLGLPGTLLALPNAAIAHTLFRRFITGKLSKV